MNIRGHIRNGVVVLEGGPALPEGLRVTVSCPDAPTGAVNGKKPVVLPLGPSNQPGSVHLTADRVAELLEDSDDSA